MIERQVVAAPAGYEVDAVDVSRGDSVEIAWRRLGVAPPDGPGWRQLACAEQWVATACDPCHRVSLGFVPKEALRASLEVSLPVSLRSTKWDLPVLGVPGFALGVRSAPTLLYSCQTGAWLVAWRNPTVLSGFDLERVPALVEQGAPVFYTRLVGGSKEVDRFIVVLEWRPPVSAWRTGVGLAVGCPEPKGPWRQPIGVGFGPLHAWGV